MSLPGVSELLRPAAPRPETASRREASGREAHPQKITVYLSAQELLDLERARLTLRARGISVDRGRLVREAIAVLLADLDTNLDDSVLVSRLRADCGEAGGGCGPANGREGPGGAGGGRGPANGRQGPGGAGAAPGGGESPGMPAAPPAESR